MVNDRRAEKWHKTINDRRHDNSPIAMRIAILSRLDAVAA